MYRLSTGRADNWRTSRRKPRRRPATAKPSGCCGCCTAAYWYRINSSRHRQVRRPAASAAEAGARVLILEGAPKPYRGGNSRHTRNFRCMHRGPLSVLTGTYTEEEYYDDLLKVTGGKTDEALARLASLSLRSPRRGRSPRRAGIWTSSPRHVIGPVDRF